jgi:hypothetical protein
MPLVEMGIHAQIDADVMQVQKPTPLLLRALDISNTGLW